MTQKEKKYISKIKRSVEQSSADRFVYIQALFSLLLILLLSLNSCDEPEIKLNRAARRTIDTLVNYQLDSITPILDSLCATQRDSIIQNAVDSIMQERKKKEERLRLQIPKE